MPLNKKICHEPDKWDPFRVPDDANENKVKAEFKDGMINVTLPKSEKSKTKAINVSVS